jgi:predicted dithiol-disulfide oxidoreductase (DUF899 family)
MINARSYPKVATREEWLTARKELLAREKAATRERDTVNALRRRLPMVLVDKDYVFSGPRGEVRLLDMFEDASQLYIHHFMWIDARNEGCPSCTQAATQTFTPSLCAALKERDVTFACISRAPIAELERWRAKNGWTFPWYSSNDSDFTYDFHATLDERRAPIEFNYRGKDELIAHGQPEHVLHGDWPAASVFIRRGNAVYHTYSAYARGMDHLALPYSFLDLTPYGRQEDWEDSPSGWPQRPTYG